MTIKLISYLSLALFLSLSTSSFSQDDYKSDSLFFYNQISIFQDWLDRQHLGDYLEFKTNPISIRENNITLYLEFKIEGIDQSINAIKQLNSEYERKTGFGLEEALFRKGVHTFEIKPENLRIKVESIPRTGELPGVSSIIRYKKNYIDNTYYVTSFSVLRAEVKDSTVIHNFEIPGNFLFPEKLELNNKIYKEKEREICNFIKSNAEVYFESKGEFYSSFPIATNTVNFEVKNMKHEVIESGILTIFDPYEKLSFTIKVSSNDEGGLKLFTSINGKYGPGLYLPRSNDYHDMDPKFKTELEAYTKRFAREKLRNWILKP